MEANYNIVVVFAIHRHESATGKGAQDGGNTCAPVAECWVLSQLFHSPLSLLSRGSLVPLHFLHYSGIICRPEVSDISPGNLDSRCDSSSLAFHMMYSAYRVIQQGGNIQPWHTPFRILKQSILYDPSIIWKYLGHKSQVLLILLWFVAYVHNK